MQRVTDPGILQQLEAPDHPTPGVRFAPQGKPGAQGLVWDHDGGRGPKTGELVIAGRPMTENAPSQSLAAVLSMSSGVPIVGPYLERGAEKAGGYARQALYGDPADQTESAVQGDVARSQAALSKDLDGSRDRRRRARDSAAGRRGACALRRRSGRVVGREDGAGGLSGGALGATDAAVRSGGDIGSIKQGAFGGIAGGVAGPPLAAIASAAGQGIANGVTRLAEGGVGLPRPVAQTLMRAAEADGALGADGLSRIRDAGPQGVLADISPSTAGVLDTAMQRGGPG